MSQFFEVDITALKQDKKNANKGNKRGQKMIEESLRDLGAGRSILIDRNSNIIAGNKTALNAAAAGIQKVIVVPTDGNTIVAVQRTDLDLDTDSKAKQLAIADNRTAQVDLEWNLDVLKEFAPTIDLAPFFSEQELRKMGVLDPLTAGAGLGDEEAEARFHHEPVSRLGDVWIAGNHRIMCGDSISIDAVETLLDGKKAGLVFTDPPYGVAFQSGMSQGGTATRFEKLANDDKILDIAPVIWTILEDNSAAFIWTAHQVYPQWRAQFNDFYKQTLVWYKHGSGIGDLEGAYACDFEIALFCVKGRPTFRGQRGMAVWDVPKDSANKYVHPTQKPVALSERAIHDFTDAGAIVADLFGGSGSTLLGCEKSGRKGRIMELDPLFVDVIVRRWEQFTGKQAILESDGRLFTQAEAEAGVQKEK